MVIFSLVFTEVEALNSLMTLTMHRAASPVQLHPLIPTAMTRILAAVLMYPTPKFHARGNNIMWWAYTHPHVPPSDASKHLNAVKWDNSNSIRPSNNFAAIVLQSLHCNYSWLHQGSFTHCGACYFLTKVTKCIYE